MKRPTMHLTRRAGTIAAATLVAIGVGGWAFAEGGVPVLSSTASDSPTTTSTAPANPGASTDNVAAAVNTTDGKTVYAIRLKIAQTDADTIDATNAAVAVASCEDCQTVAIALEGVLVIGEPENVEPTNIALAINSGCSGCQTLATAYQSVVQNDTRVRITGAGRREIADVRVGLQSLRNSGLDILAVKAKVDEYAARLVRVLHEEVRPIGRPEGTTDKNPGPSTTTTSAAPSSTSTSTLAPTTTTSSSTTTTTAAP